MTTYLDEFLKTTNERARTRLFDESDYKRFKNAVRCAKRAAKQLKPYYKHDNAGGVANSYKYVTSTAQWGVWTTAKGEVKTIVRRVPVSGRAVKNPYYGGEQAYRADFRQLSESEQIEKQGVDAMG